VAVAYLLELDGVSDIVHPVVGMRRPAEQVARDGADEGQAGLALALVEEGQALLEAGYDGLREGAVEGDVARHEDREGAVRQQRLDVGELLLLAREHDARRAVDARDLDALQRAGVGREEAQAGGLTEPHGQHAARAGETLLLLAAVVHDAHGFLQRQQAGRVGRRHLTRRVAHHLINTRRGRNLLGLEGGRGGRG
jgi:hypothetical protein